MAQLEHIEAIEKRLWSAADTLRANSTFASNEFFLPVMGLVFLRHAYSRFLAVKDELEKNLPSRGGKKRELTKNDFSGKGAIYLCQEAQFDYLVGLPDGTDRAAAIIAAMESIESDYETLRGVLPKDEYNELDNEILGSLLRTLNPEELKHMSGDVFGRIYEYFLTQFAGQGAHDGGEFFTPISLVSLIANILEPCSGKVLDPACGSGGMFVQSARVVERRHENPSDRLTFYGMEKNATTIRLAKMNLAVHGLEGDIQKAISYYEDPHELIGKADFVMANPPFNVDEIDAEKVKSDPRLPFGLPSVNKKGKVSNGNYVWMSYFYSYLKKTGRAGFVMAAGAETAGRDEAIVRRKMIETGDVDIMVAVRSNFFYTRTVPCMLWFINRGKPDLPSPPAPLPEGEGGLAQSTSQERAGGGRPMHYRGGYEFSGLLGKVRELRAKQTPAEALFWELVRDRRFMDLKFRRQHQYGDYVLDFYCDSCKLGIELDGGVHERTKERDRKRDAFLISSGLRILRFKNEELFETPQQVLEKIASVVQPVSAVVEANVQSDSHPSPAGRGAGGEGNGGVRYSQNGVPLNVRSTILMIDARNVYRKVTRKIYDFSPEQEQNLLAIVWLYRGETERFKDLVRSYREKSAAVDLSTVAEFWAELEQKRKTATIAEIEAATKERLAALEAEAAKENDPKKAREILKGKKTLEEKSAAAVESLKLKAYYLQQAEWLETRFPDAKFRDVEGLVKAVSLDEIAANDWSLTPGRYVGVAEDEGDDEDFVESMTALHDELKELNAKAADLAATIDANWKELMK